jgi:hypothetical protein
MDQPQQDLSAAEAAAVRIIGVYADDPSLHKVAQAIISIAERKIAREDFVQLLQDTVLGIEPGELHECEAYLRQGEPFIAILRQDRLAYRISEAADALPLPQHLEHWTPERDPLPKWRVLDGEPGVIKCDWMPATLRALEVVKRELGEASLVSHQGDTAI